MAAVAALVLGALGLGADGGDIANQVGELVGSLVDEQGAPAEGGVDISQLAGLIGGGDVSLDSILRLLTAFGATDYAAQVASGTVDTDALLAKVKSGPGDTPAAQPASDAPADAPAVDADPEALRASLEAAGVDAETAAKLAADPAATVAAAERLGVDRETASRFASDPEGALRALEDAGIDPVGAAPMLAAQL